MNHLSDVAPAFIEMAHRIVWSTVATVDAKGRRDPEYFIRSGNGTGSGWWVGLVRRRLEPNVLT
jgi:hypothetical protein